MLKTEGYENSELFMALTPKNGVKASKLYSYKPIDGTGDFHWSRNHTAYRLNQEGVLELMGNNVPRIDYTNTCPELLIEKESENLILRSQEFDNASWGNFNTLITANSTNAPNSLFSADKLIANAVNANHTIYQTITNVSATWTYSIFAKKAEYDRVILFANNTNFVGFNLTNGNIESSLGIGITSAKIINIGNGWYKCSITSNSTSTGTSVGVSLFNTSYTNGNSNPTFTGDGTSGLYIWGAQLEESDYATSYIPTTTTSVTRPKDVCYNTVNGYNDADWSVVMRVRLNNIGSSADEPLLALSDGTTDYYFAIYTDSNPKLHFTWYNNPDQDTYSTADLSNGIVNVGVSFDSVTADYIIVIDGTLFDSGTLVNIGSGLFGNFSRLDLGSVAGTGSPDKDGIIATQYFNTALTQSDLENLTA